MVLKVKGHDSKIRSSGSLQHPKNIRPEDPPPTDLSFFEISRKCFPAIPSFGAITKTSTLLQTPRNVVKYES